MTFTRVVTSTVTASIGKSISTVTVRRSLLMSGPYARIPRVCVFYQYNQEGHDESGAGNMLVGLCNVMFTDDSRFNLETEKQVYKDMA